jgi:hypothetical protein
MSEDRIELSGGATEANRTTSTCPKRLRVYPRLSGAATK